jgi:hypothetical protein
MGVIAFTNAVGIQLSVSYCIDSYKDLSGEAMVTVIIVRNTMYDFSKTTHIFAERLEIVLTIPPIRSFAVNYGLTPWTTNMGLQNAFLVAAFVGMAQCATFFIFVKYGKQLRRTSSARYAKYVEKMAIAGVIH